VARSQGIAYRSFRSAYPALELREGRFFEPGEKGILLNRGVARKLGVGVGGTVVALGTTADGRLSGVKLTVTGVWKVGGLPIDADQLFQAARFGSWLAGQRTSAVA